MDASTLTITAVSPAGRSRVEAYALGQDEICGKRRPKRPPALVGLYQALERIRMLVAANGAPTAIPAVLVPN